MRIYLQVVVLVVFFILPIFSDDDTDYVEIMTSLGESEDTIDDIEKKIKDLEDNLVNKTKDLENELFLCKDESQNKTVQLADLHNETLQNNAVLTNKDNEIAHLKVELKKLQENNENITKVMKESSLTISALKLTINEKNNQIVVYETQINKTGSEIVQLNTKLKKTELELKNFQDLNSTLSQSLEECRSQAQSSKKSCESTIKDKDATISKLTEINTKQAITEINSENCTKNLENLRKEYAKKQNQIAIAEMNSENCTKNLGNLQKECTEKQNQIDKFKKDQKNHDKRKSDAKNKIDVLTSDKNELNDKLNKCKKDYEALNEECKRKESNNSIALKKCEADVTTSKKELNVLKETAEKTKNTAKQLELCISSKTLAANKSKSNEDQSKKIAEQTSKLEKCQSEITACQKKTTNLDAKIKTKIKEIDDLKNRNDKSLGECQAERNEVKRRAEDTFKNLEYCNKTLNALKIESTGRDKQLKKFDEQNNTLANCQREFAALNATLKTYNDEKRWLKIYKEDYNRAVSELRYREGELRECTQNRDQYQSDLTACNKKLEEKDREFNETQPYLNSYNTIISELSSCTEEKDKYKLDSDSCTEKHKNCSDSLEFRNNLYNQLIENCTQKRRELNKCKSESKQLQPANTSCHDQIKPYVDAKINCTRTLARIRMQLQDCEFKLQKPFPQPRLPTLAQTVTPPQQRNCQNSNGIISIRLPSNDEFPVLCTDNVMGSGWIMILNRFDGSLNFTLPWKEYRNGFGDLSGEFFLGLQKIYLITNSQPYELYIKLIDENKYQYYATYDNIQIGNEQSQFKLESLGHFYNNNIGDALSYSINNEFLTYDWDKRFCASKYGGGWWYTVSNCHGAGNLHGNYDGNFEWYDVLRKRYIKLKSVRMMIRPKSTTSSYG